MALQQILYTRANQPNRRTLTFLHGKGVVRTIGLLFGYALEVGEKIGQAGLKG